MKIRNGFVSNSSSCNFTCENCGDLYEHGQEEGEHQGGLCHKCEENGCTACNVCEELMDKKGMFVTIEDFISRGAGSGGDSAYIDTKYTCPKCLAGSSKKQEEWIKEGNYREWIQRISNPDYKMDEVDEILSKALIENGH